MLYLKVSPPHPLSILHQQRKNQAVDARKAKPLLAGWGGWEGRVASNRAKVALS